MDPLKPPEGGQNGGDPVEITVRFSASLPDLLLAIEDPTTSTAATLKQLIRKHLPSSLSERRIRLIYSGKALVDTTALSTQLKLPSSREPSRISTPTPQNDSKGKSPVYDPPILRIYVHCSIGDIDLSPSDLALEVSQATLLDSTSASHGSTKAPATATPTGPSAPSMTTTPAPRGFDRLLTAGFSPEEVRMLRSQFMAIQAHSHTPDTMPSPTTLRAMEDRWLDNDTSGAAAAAAAGGGPGVALAADEDVSGALDDLLWGAVMGFFWPIGCLWWICREEGVWSRRKRWAVVLGVLVNMGIGGLRWMN